MKTFMKIFLKNFRNKKGTKFEMGMVKWWNYGILHSGS